MSSRSAAAFPFLILFLSVGLSAPSPAQVTVLGSGGENLKGTDQATARAPMSLSECLGTALANSSRRAASSAAVEMAEAQVRQANSSWWPQLTAEALASYMDEDLNFLFPSRNMTIPPVQFTIPANTFGPGSPPFDLPLIFPSQEFPVPEQDVKVMDRSNLLASLKLTFPIYTGGLRPAMTRQAELGLEVARHEGRRTDHEVIYDVKRAYYAAVLTGQLLAIGMDTLARMEATLSLTERLYKEGSGTVKKTDFLRNKSTVEGLRTLVAELESRDKTVKSALATLMELGPGAIVEPALEEIPFSVTPVDPESLLAIARKGNPMLAKVRTALEVAEAKQKAARSGFLPKFQFQASFTQIENPYSAGFVTPRNSTSWTLGLGMQVPIFDGFLASNKVSEAKAFGRKLQSQRKLLDKSIALDIEQTCHRIAGARKREESSREAFQAAAENRDLNVRAYQADLVETQDVIEAQLMEAFMKWQYQKVLYDHVAELARLDLILGTDTN